MAPRTVYLDQNKWIEVARVINGKVQPDARLQAVVTWIEHESACGTVVFPLSAIHYYETSKIGDHGRRARLGKVLWNISRGYTLAPYDVILSHELEVALKPFFPEKVKEREYRVLGRGASHAFGEEMSFRLPPERRSCFSSRAAAKFEARAQEQIEESLLTGVGHDGEPMPSLDLSRFSEEFQRHVETMRSRLSGQNKDLTNDALYAIELLDMGQLLDETLARQGISSEEMEALGPEGLKGIIEAMPARRVSLQLRRQYLKNEDLQTKSTDLNDWVSLGLAVAYCDVCVCEKQFADLVKRDGFETRSDVLTDIRDLQTEVS